MLVWLREEECVKVTVAIAVVSGVRIVEPLLHLQAKRPPARRRCRVFKVAMQAVGRVFPRFG